MRQELCVNGWGKSKVRYKTRAQAEKHHGQGLHIYRCKNCLGWHLTSQEQRHKTTTPPSAAKLRRVLSDRAALIASQQRWLDASEARLKKAEEARKAAQEELTAIAVMVARLHRV